jgi:type II secretory ATPase GspE/PulE/Tfp pilus assembly ATPase PilB-like protein
VSSRSWSRQPCGASSRSAWRAGCAGAASRSTILPPRTGFSGRFALHEVLIVTEEIERLIADRAHSEDVKKAAVAQGMTTLAQVGFSQVIAGVTSLEEILRVVA